MLFCWLWSKVQRQAASMSKTSDAFCWIWSDSDCYSARSAYRAFFCGRTDMPGAAEIWSSGAPPQLKLFAWLVAKNRCWTSNRLASRGVPHQPCYPLCLQEPEMLDHLPVRCSFARTVWFNALSDNGWANFTPLAQDEVVDGGLLPVLQHRVQLERNSRLLNSCHEPHL